MIRILLFVFFVILIFLPEGYAGEEYEFLHCFSGKGELMHESRDLLPILTYKSRGIAMSKSENNFLNNASTHCKGFIIDKIGSPTMILINYCVAIDPDENMIIWGSAEGGGAAEQILLHGTGKYKGIKGSLKAQVAANAKKTLKSLTYQQCSTIKGTYELSPE